MSSLVGIWTLVEARAVDTDGRALPPPLGPQPMGVVIFEAERMVGAVGDGRTTVKPGDPPRVYFSYTGTYQFDGEILVTRAEDASRPEMIVEQVRRIRFESPTRTIHSPVSGLAGYTGIEVVWERIG